jgi:hypothetical protein
VVGYYWNVPQQGRQGTYNGILRSVRVTVVTVESNKYYIFWAWTCNLRYATCKALAPCYIPNFYTLSHKRHDFWKQKLSITCVFLFSVQRLPRTVLILRIQRDITVNVHRSSCKVPVFLVRFERNLNFFDRFSKNTKISFHENPSNGRRIVPCGRTDRYDVANSRFSQYC